jgi:hypothetical protein
MPIYTSCLFDEYINIESKAPDEISGHSFEPMAQFVLCRDLQGNPTAVYGALIWDFNPYRLGPRRIRAFSFAVFPKNRIAEAKKILFWIIYSGSAGRLGRLSPSTLSRYLGLLKSLAEFCNSFKDNDFVGELTIWSVLSNKSYLGKFVKLNEHKNSFKNIFKAFLRYASRFPKGCFNSNVISPEEFNIGVRETKQTCVIPSRIYVQLMNQMLDQLDHIHRNMDGLDNFIGCLKDRAYGTSVKYQRYLKIPLTSLRPTYEEVVSAHGLGNLLVGFCESKDRKDFTRVLGKIQFLIKHIIHLFTGMRDLEVSAVRYSCIKTKLVHSGISDSDGVVRDKERIVSLISTTTKLMGYPKTESWLAPEDVIKAVEVAQMICRGLSTVIDLCPEKDNVNLFLGSWVLTKNSHKSDTIPHYSKRRYPIKITDEFIITQEDLDELSLTDPSRDFLSDEKYHVGSVWPLAFHQYRRSLGFFGPNSGFLSMPTVKKQFKHTSLLMAQYYSNNFKNMKSFFGFYDQKSKKFILPGGHIAYEFQMGMSMDTAEQLVLELTKVASPLFGGTGSYMEKQKEKLNSDEINVQELRSETEKLAAQGQIAYRRTLLGGCTKLGPCDDYLLGNAIKCLTCQSAVIKVEKVKLFITDVEQERSLYEPSSGEYQICNSELNSLRSFEKRLVSGAGEKIKL